MAITRQRLKDTLDEEGTRRPPRHPPGWPAPALAGAWILVIGAIYAFAPAASTSAHVARWAEFLMLAFDIALMGAVLGLVWRRSWSFGASGVASILGMGVAVACAVTDHHLGIYWAYELAGFTALGLASGVARLHA